MEEKLIFSPNELGSYIEFLRADLIRKGLILGLSHDKTVTASQELDFFLFQYQILKSNFTSSLQN